MDNVTKHFGLIIAYILPGFIALAGISPLAPVVAGWLYPTQAGGFAAPIYVLLAATAAGMVVSCFRWLLVDQLHAMTGVLAPAFNARALEAHPVAFSYLVENHYRYYQFYANTLVAVLWAYAVHRSLPAGHLGLGADVAVLVFCIVLFAGSRDALTRYRNRSSQLGLLGFETNSGDSMTNGIDHNHGHGTKPDGKPSPKKSEPKKPDTSKPSPLHEAKPTAGLK